MLLNDFKRKISHITIKPQNLRLLLLLNYTILLATLLILLTTPTVSGYEFSIYDAYPDYFWGLIISTITLGYFCAVLAILHNDTKKYWPLGFLTAVIANCLLLSLPLVRGYFSYGSGDVLTHIGFMRDLANYGTIDGNLYPILHILGFCTFEIAGLSFEIITMIIPPVFSILVVIYWYILGREMFNNKTGALSLGVLTLIILGSIPILDKSNSLFSPNYEVNLLIPLIMYCLIKSQKFTNSRMMAVTLIVLSVLIVFLHPLAAILLMSIYVLSYFSDRFLPINSTSKPYTANAWMIAVIMAAFFSIWSTYLHRFGKVVDPFIASIIGTDLVESEVMANLNLVNMVDVDIVYLIKLGFLTFGINAICGSLAAICLLYLLIQHIHKNITINRFLFHIIVCFVALFVLSVIIFFTISEFGYERIYRIVNLFTLLIVSSTIAIAYQRLNNVRTINRTLITTLICITVFTLIVLSIFTLHLSPITKHINQQVPECDYYGMVTFFDKRDNSIPILESGISQRRYYESIYGVCPPKTNIRYSLEGALRPPDHFGYDRFDYIGSNYDERQYFLLTSLGRHFYESMYPEFQDKWRFMNQDFENLESDYSATKMYSNNNLDIYLINPSNATNTL